MVVVGVAVGVGIVLHYLAFCWLLYAEHSAFVTGAMEIAIKEDLRRHLTTLHRLELLLNLFGVDWSQIWLQPQANSPSPHQPFPLSPL